MIVDDVIAAMTAEDDVVDSATALINSVPQMIQDAVAKAWQLAGQSGEPRLQLPPRDMALSLRELMRGAFGGAAAGVGEGVRGAAQGGGLQFLAPQLVE